jgi:hypothetical protein
MRDRLLLYYEMNASANALRAAFRWYECPMRSDHSTTHSVQLCMSGTHLEAAKAVIGSSSRSCARASTPASLSTSLVAILRGAAISILKPR